MTSLLDAVRSALTDQPQSLASILESVRRNKYWDRARYVDVLTVLWHLNDTGTVAVTVDGVTTLFHTNP
jgi:hypothetical protein